MTEGVLSGKTGFTGKAGYCYVCGCKKDGKTLVVSLLGCGWPNNETYKWNDTMALLKYGEANYQYAPFWKEPELSAISVKEGVGKNQRLKETVYLRSRCACGKEEKK